tara:strand:- start:90 stop:572 length:483 start_codon:yes stop_codon:yes gene_type:complete
MLDKIFNFIDNLAKKVSEKDITRLTTKSKNNLFVGFIVVMVIWHGITTYQVGECVNCVGLTGEEAVQMLNNGTPTNNELSRWYDNRTYIPFTSVGKFVKQWMINAIGPVLGFSGIFFLLYFIGNIIKNKIKQFKTKKLSELGDITSLMGSFGSNKKINKK